MPLSPAFRRRWPWLAAVAVVVALTWWLWPKAPAEAPAEAPPVLAADGSLGLTDEQIELQKPADIQGGSGPQARRVEVTLQ